MYLTTYHKVATLIMICITIVYNFGSHTFACVVLLMELYGQAKNPYVAFFHRDWAMDTKNIPSNFDS